MQETPEEKIGRRLRASIMTDDECRAGYEIDHVLEACHTGEESALVRKLLRLVDLYEDGEEDGSVVNLSYFALEMEDGELGKYVLDVFGKCRTETGESAGTGHTAAGADYQVKPDRGNGKSARKGFPQEKGRLNGNRMEMGG